MLDHCALCVVPSGGGDGICGIPGHLRCPALVLRTCTCDFKMSRCVQDKAEVSRMISRPCFYLGLGLLLPTYCRLVLFSSAYTPVCLVLIVLLGMCWPAFVRRVPFPSLPTSDVLAARQSESGTLLPFEWVGPRGSLCLSTPCSVWETCATCAVLYIVIEEYAPPHAFIRLPCV
jgi:hypothetical protein